ncbi:glycine cleavage system aminomethyltransferase GcvT [Geobacter sulfurreducens]|uniref:aminomethyltransferase n=1 Tax=Geobacter sulfurreducens (strain ATCC 51573 / DSM 12127 / PCA) TaxID=243231 RepID=Q74G72_GEOSL|nr:glycine cleavage system aminomethyltransferase GcvT [Geobacter sulfurreducens]AAR33707.1 glycine cleavage system T protein [Geobacter sulfurreducens PCA]ADI83206.1 glycine cleavage system T protein [Geobacter sulfurreducens KN400]UAC04457.1 glycine cleavage system aminomethyltransferase GcvT [Geobacter sulfurreducens]UTG93073.1 glycine cleavage system aminomethyltransferase GcvT [Geobacter sulfurreducens]HCD95924.1 glycine cleavage system aminomethyltransferase GcvT [Geobacter sulfurreducen
MDTLASTPLRIEHERLNALMAPFGGWNMPIQYEGIIAEHRWCREKASLFDICHMGEFLFTGDIIADGLEDVFTFSVASIPVGRSRYGFLLNGDGGIMDDLIVFRLAQNEAMVVVNAATIGKDFAAISARLGGGGFQDISAATAKLDLQGPLSREVLVEVIGPEIAAIPYFKFIRTKVLGADAIVSRTGYTGELGYEIFLPSDRVVELWQRLLADPRVRPAGLGARDVLRLEVGYSLYGSDIDESTTPLEAGLESFVSFDKSFVGKDALLAQRAEGVMRRRVAFQVASRRSPRHDYEILFQGEQVGAVTSGVFSPMLGCGLGLGYVTPGTAVPGAPLTIRHERVSMDATVVDAPFYRGGSLRA